MSKTTENTITVDCKVKGKASMTEPLRDKMNGRNKASF